MDTKSESKFIGITFAFLLLAIPVAILFREAMPYFVSLATLVVPATVIVNAILKGRQAIFSIGFSVFFVLANCSPTILISNIGSLSGPHPNHLQGLGILNNLVSLLLACMFGWICKAIFGGKKPVQTSLPSESSASDS